MTTSYTEGQVQAEIAKLLERYSDLEPHVARRWAEQELHRAWRAEREYDHTEVADTEPGELGYTPGRRTAEIRAYTMPADSDRGQVWVTRLSRPELIELRDQINAYLDAGQDVTWCDCGEQPPHTTRVHPDPPPAGDEHLQAAHGPILTRGDLDAAEAEHAATCKSTTCPGCGAHDRANRLATFGGECRDRWHATTCEAQ